MQKKLFMAVLIPALLVTFALNLAARDLDRFTAPNYIYLEETVMSKNNVTADMKTLLKGNLVFLYVSGCHLDKEALPAFQGLARRYRKAKFLRIGQHSSARDYLLKRYGSFGAPKIFLIYRGNLVSHVTYHYNRGRFAGWKRSIEKWAADTYPHVAPIERYRNIYPVSSFNYRKVMDGKKVVLMRIDTRMRGFGPAMRSLYAMAARFKNITFAFETKSIPYNQEFEYRFRKAYNSYSIVNDGAIIEDSFRKGRQASYNNRQLAAWISRNFTGGSKKSAARRDQAWLKKVILSADSHSLATMDAGEFKRLDRRYRVIKGLRFQQSFYVLINAVTDPRRNRDTALALIQALKYRSQGGFDKVVKSKITRQKVYGSLIGRLIAHEKDRKIRNELKKLQAYYNR